MAVDLRHLRSLVAVAEVGSISAAARRLYITQPALSVALAQLERDVGVRLLYRHNRGAALTQAGEILVERANRALEIVDEAVLATQRIGNISGKQLTIGLLPATMSTLPRALVDSFQAHYPQVCLRYRELSYITHTSDLVTGRVDLCFLWPPYDEPALRLLELSQEPRVLGVASSHPLADLDAVALDDFLDLPFPGFHPANSGGWFQSWFFDPQRQAAATTTADEAATPFEMAIIVQEGRAIAPAARSFALSFTSVGVRWLELTDAPPATLALAWRAGNRNPALDAFVQTSRAFLEIQHLGLAPVTVTAGPTRTA